jgi:hypothetical protein
MIFSLGFHRKKGCRGYPAGNSSPAFLSRRLTVLRPRTMRGVADGLSADGVDRLVGIDSHLIRRSYAISGSKLAIDKKGLI